MTTPLTIYRFGLRGNSANESIGKHRFRTKKHSKVNKSGQKMMAYLFGTRRPWVQVPSPRPKKPIPTDRLGLAFLFKNRRDLNPKRAANVKKNSPTDCFLMSRCADGYCCKATVVKQGRLPQARCVPSPRPKIQFQPIGWGWIF